MALLALLPFLAGLVPLPGQQAWAAEAGTGTRTASVDLTSVSPSAPRKGDTLTLRGTVTNEGTSPLINASLSPREGVRLSSRDSIDEAMQREGFSTPADGSLIRGHSTDIATVPPGLARPFSLQIPVSELALGPAGVYQVTVTLTGQTEAAQWDQVLGAGRTLVPWQQEGAYSGSDAPEPTRLTVLWPLISGTHLTAETDGDEEQTPLFKDDSLLAEISSGGRLHQLVSRGAELPVTWVIDPDLLASVDAMTEEYRVRSADGPVRGQGQDAARAWLHQLREAVSEEEVVALPFGDPDLASLAHQGKDVPGVLGQLKKATDLADVTVRTVLGVEPDTDFAWPVEGAIDPAIVSVATSANAQHIITRTDSLRTAGDLPYTPTAARPIGGGTTALAADAQLSTLFEGDMSRAGNVSRAHQQLLAQTLSIAEQAPSRTRSILLAPQRMPSASQVEAMATALDALRDDAEWVEFISLAEASEAGPDPEANREVPGTDQYPDRLREQELSADAFQSLRATQRVLDDFSVILTRADRVVTPFGNAIHRGLSTSWRNHAGEAARYRSSVHHELVGLTEQVQLIQKSPITLSGRSATIPVTVQNNLVQGVEGLELRLTSSRRLGLDIGEPQEIAVGGGHSQSVKFSTTARANGRTLLEAQLYTQDGKPYGDPMRFHADVTSITSAVLMVIAGGVLLVVLAGIRMYTQRKRAVADAPAGESGPDTGGGDGDAAGPGEKVER
ncbi:DUF6049 family protein [Streptomyces sp. ACA25]|uniref:DUF6049 family protein n=1 Tax=Streptomyces sp. ACA25 TaxID=3022596 RepID=UPI00230797CC|nr:DUF6049 family protein [Streptomyces sp. ACA25]MDB1086244.1 DUF6049 family protein [Streptomyces sp. ACA25]